MNVFCVKIWNQWWHFLIYDFFREREREGRHSNESWNSMLSVVSSVHQSINQSINAYNQWIFFPFCLQLINSGVYSCYKLQSFHFSYTRNICCCRPECFFFFFCSGHTIIFIFYFSGWHFFFFHSLTHSLSVFIEFPVDVRLSSLLSSSSLF